jgi:hypothetical protein
MSTVAKITIRNQNSRVPIATNLVKIGPVKKVRPIATSLVKIGPVKKVRNEKSKGHTARNVKTKGHTTLKHLRLEKKEKYNLSSYLLKKMVPEKQATPMPIFQIPASPIPFWANFQPSSVRQVPFLMVPRDIALSDFQSQLPPLPDLAAMPSPLPLELTSNVHGNPLTRVSRESSPTAAPLFPSSSPASLNVTSSPPNIDAPEWQQHRTIPPCSSLLEQICLR